MLDILKQFPYLGIMEKIFKKVPKDYLINNNIYKESSPKKYGTSKHKRKKK